MPIHAQSLFHYTATLTRLKSILADRFRLTYCREQYILGAQSHVSCYPMVSFCDIPLMQTGDHRRKYGMYAIGLTKEWGIRKGLNPVLYIENSSYLSKDIQGGLDSLVKISGTMVKMVTSRHDKIERLANETKNAEGWNLLVQKIYRLAACPDQAGKVPPETEATEARSADSSGKFNS